MILNREMKLRREATIPTVIAPSAAPVQTQAPIGIPPQRLDAFRKTVADRLRDGKLRGEPETTVIQHITTEQVAMAKALTDHDLVHRMATIFIAEMGKLVPSAANAISMEQAHLQIESILRNRINDAKQFVLSLAQPEFIAAARAEALQPAKPAPEGCVLPDYKKTEIVEDMVLPQKPTGPEPAVHVAATALGHQLVHQALANLFKPDGPVRADLVSALTKAWPQAAGGQMQQLAETWLKARHNPAHAVANGLLEKGELYIAAMNMADQLQKMKLGADEANAAIAKAQASSKAAVTPAPVTTAPRAHAGIVAPAQHEMVVDV